MIRKAPIVGNKKAGGLSERERKKTSEAVQLKTGRGAEEQKNINLNLLNSRKLFTFARSNLLLSVESAKNSDLAFRLNFSRMNANNFPPRSVA